MTPEAAAPQALRQKPDPAASADAGLQAWRNLVWWLGVPVLALLSLLSVLQYQQRVQDVQRELLRQASVRAQDLEALAFPAINHVHDMRKLLEMHWQDPPQREDLLRQAIRPWPAGGAADGPANGPADGPADGWTLDRASAAQQTRLGQFYWAPLDGRPPDSIWLRRAQGFIDVARAVQARQPGFESTWFAAADENVSWGYPFAPTAEMLHSYGLPSLRALDVPRLAGVYRAERRLAQGVILLEHWVEPYVSQSHSGLVQSHVAHVLDGARYLGEVSVDLPLHDVQRLTRRWMLPGTQVWVTSRLGLVVADARQALAAPSGPGNADTRVQVKIDERLPPPLTRAQLDQALAQAGDDGRPGLVALEGWVLVAAKRARSPWVYVQATPSEVLRAAVLPTLLPNALLAAALLLVLLLGQWFVGRFLIKPSLSVLAYLRELSLDAAAPAPQVGPRWRGWVQAITETFGTQRELQRREHEREAFKSALVDQAPMAIVTLDDQGQVTEFNPAAERLLGLDARQALGRPLPPGLLPPPQAFAPLQQQQLQKPAEDYESQVQRADGSRFPAQVQRFELPLAHANYQIIFITDLSARQAAAQQIERQREDLRQSEKLGAMGSLLAYVAHELNNPLAIAMGRASLLETKLEGHPGVSDAVKIREAADRCGRIVRTFLNMARQKPAARRAVQLADMVRAATEMLGYTLRSHGIELELALERQLPEVQADPDQIGQVVLNLLVNAQQALLDEAAPATGLLTTPPQKQTPRIIIHSGIETPRPDQPERETRVWLRVCDNGPGVPADRRARIFEPFFTTKAAGQGTGLGLALSRTIVEEHGGSLVLEDSALGACFRLSLPLNGRLPARPETSTAGDLDLQHLTARVLVVDDEPDLCELMREVLEGAGLDVAVAESGAVALELLQTARFEAIVSDLRMPDMDGAALLQAVRVLVAAPDSGQPPQLARRMLFVSGDTLSQPAQHWLQAQDLPSLDKPFTPQELLTAVRALLQRS